MTNAHTDTKHNSADNAHKAQKPFSLKKLALRGSVWTIICFGLVQSSRLLGNIIVAKMLAPESFGMMAVVNALLLGLTMFSDVGLRPSIIQNKRGEDPVFIHTAWSIQIIRGIIIMFIAMLMAYPLAILNDEPRLVPLILVTSLTTFITGFDSVLLLVHARRLQLGRVLIIQVVATFISVLVMIGWAYMHPTVWALVGGAFTGTLVSLVASHTMLSGPAMRLRWEKSAVYELIHFGKWIFISTALGFLVARADVFVLGSFASMSMLGLYAIAKSLSRLVIEVLMKLSSMVLLPVYSRLAERGTDVLRSRMIKARAALLLLSLPPLWMLTLWGGVLIDFLYDDRYQESGWILQVLAAGAAGNAIVTTIYPVLLAVGDSYKHMLKSVGRVVCQILGMGIGAYFWGVPGFVVGLALVDLLSYPYLVYLIRPYGVWLPWLDLLAFGSSIAVALLAWWIYMGG